ncbi:LAFE_0A03312g1_1 [Lachancea fermentati]|uniref:LAFE_0A03312g1_1 n=1 Tax=Lachancea fermentati TaxID=4955 RepID=A0A1G4M6P1_LACFM|nr:LAFE_0A03312g1_1 [Lachancea fermentati]
MLSAKLQVVLCALLFCGARTRATDSYHNLHLREHANRLGKLVHGRQPVQLFRRSGTCSFPNKAGMVAVQKNGQNAGWALASDVSCSYGSWCPYACEPGYLMAQWDSGSTSYTYPESQYGGLYCDENGNLQTPDSSRGYCYEGEGTLDAHNSASSGVAFCQTVLPGNEEMLIPTQVDAGSTQPLAVPGPDYWAGTAAHYYVNAPGTGVSDACQWGSSSDASGNWAPYVVGANADSSGNTYVKVGWNPEYVDAFGGTTPGFGLRVTCDDKSQCDGLPCAIDPSQQSVNQVGGSSVSGAGNAAYCVVTVKNGAKAAIEVFDSASSNNKRELQHHHRRHEADGAFRTVGGGTARSQTAASV